MFTRVLICGSRGFGHAPGDRELMASALQRWAAKHGVPEIVIEGCEPTGADWLAGHDLVPELWPDTTVQHFPADWSPKPGGPVRYRRDGTPYDPSAGPTRNKQMLVEGRPLAVIAFSHDIAHSRGTANMVRQAKAAGVPVWLPVPQR
jgi:hypothetical protein